MLTNTAPTSKQQIAVVTYANEGGKCRSQRQVGVSATDPRSSSEAATEGGWEGGREGAPRRAARATKRVSPRTTKHKQEQRTQEWRRRPERLLYVRTSVCLSASCVRQKLSSSFVGEVYIHNEQTTTNQRTNEPTGREGKGREGEGRGLSMRMTNNNDRRTDGQRKLLATVKEGTNERTKAGRNLWCPCVATVSVAAHATQTSHSAA